MSFALRLQPLLRLRSCTAAPKLAHRTLGTTQRLTAIGNQFRRLPTSADKERLFQLKDKVPSDFRLIYKAPLEHYVSWAKNVSTCTAAVIAGLAVYNWANVLNLFAVSAPLNLGRLVAEEDDIWYFAAGFVAVNIALRVFVAKYPLRIYKNLNQYIAIYDSQIPFRSAQHHFQRGQVSQTRSALSPWPDSTYRLGSRTSLLLTQYFKTPAELNQMMALDKAP